MKLQITETLEEAQYNHCPTGTYSKYTAQESFRAGAKWQQERSYSLDEIKTAMKNSYGIKYFSEHKFLENLKQFKKK
jgi:hypothetical protein